jgi:hypothetical protein
MHGLVAADLLLVGNGSLEPAGFEADGSNLKVRICWLEASGLKLLA